MQVTNHSNNKRKMKEELLEAIYGTVERLEQKVDELSASPKYAGAETVPASNDTTKLEKSIIAMFGKEEEVRGKISKLRDAIVVFVDLISLLVSFFCFSALHQFVHVYGNLVIGDNGIDLSASQIGMSHHLGNAFH
jgi:SMC interacting uncharacterized protein involved in chromosome segregation